MTDYQTFTLFRQSEDPESPVLVNLITVATFSTSLQLSILPSFISCIPQSIHTLRISFILPIGFADSDPAAIYSKLSYFSLESLLSSIQGGVENDGVANLCVRFDWETVTVNFGEDVKTGTAVVDGGQQLPWMEPFTRVFPLLPERRRQAIFAPIALYSSEERRFLPISGDEASLPSLRHSAANIIQLSLPTCTGSSIASLPVELLSLIFDFLTTREVDDFLFGYDAAFIVSQVCQLWRALSVAYLDEVDSVKEKHDRLKVHPAAGRFWTELRIEQDMNVSMVKEVIVGSSNVTEVWVDAFWNEEEAKIVLHAIEGLTKLEKFTFGHNGSRKWKKEEVEGFMRKMAERIKRLTTYAIEDTSNPSSGPSPTAGLELHHGFTSLTLQKYPPLTSLSLPSSLLHLSLSHLCPLPPSFSSVPLPPLLEHLSIKLSPFSADGNPSILPTPLDLSHLKHLTSLFLDGGADTSNLVSPLFFGTLKNAKGIESINLVYCAIGWANFPEFIRWFFGDRGVKKVKRGGNYNDEAGGSEDEPGTRGRTLSVLLFFGEWQEEEIDIATQTMKECGVSEWNKWSKVWEGMGNDREN